MASQTERGLSTYQPLRAVEVLVAPIDFDHLIVDGVLRVSDWFEVLDVKRLPRRHGSESGRYRTPNLVKFRNPSKRLTRQLRRGW